MNDQDFIFDEYLKILEEGIKSQAGVGGTTGPTSPEEVQKRATRTKRLRLHQDAENENYFNVLELMSDYFGASPEKVKNAITKFMGSEKVKSQLNPMEGGGVFSNPYTIPLVNLPNRILGIRGLKTNEKPGPFLNFLNKAEKALSGLFEQETGSKAEDIKETDKLLSFKSRLVQRSGEDSPRQERARVGGSSKDEREAGGKFTHITNTREDTPRLGKYSDKSFTFEPRGAEKPELPEPQRQQDAERILNNKVLKYQYDLMKQGLKGEELKSAVQKFRSEQAVQNRANIVAPIEKPKAKKSKSTKPKAKKQINKESYFIKVIPF
jgi:hypothetical protein